MSVTCPLFRCVLLACSLSLANCGLFASPEAALAQGAKAKLPGASAVIDAADYPTLQEALDALPETGGMVRLPAGEFEISQPLVVRTEDVTIEGAGTATHIKNINEKGAPALVIAHRKAKDARRDRDHKLWRVRLANFRITGNAKSGHGIEARLINEIFIDGVTVSYHGGDGIRLDYCYEDPRVCNSLITYNKGTGLNLLGCHDIVVSANQFEENQDALHCFDGFNLTMTGNNLDDHLGCGVVIENTYGSVVSGNMIEECAADAIVLDRDCYGIALSANVIAHNGAGIDLRDAHGCAISANSLTLMKGFALRIGPKSGRIAVTGNSFSNSFIGEGKVRRASNDQEAGGLVLDGASDVAISGNVFSGVSPKAFALDENKKKSNASRRILFANNVLVETSSDHEALKKIKGSVTTDNIDSEK